MGKIYTEQAVSDYAHSTGEPGIGVEAQRVAGYGKYFEQEAAKYENRAKNSYSTALKIEASDTMNSLYEQYSDNPVALDQAFKKAYDKVSGQIVDDDVKVDFLVDVSLKRQAYISKAQENKRRNDYRINKSLTYNGIDKNTETIGLTFSSILGGDFSPDTITAYGKTVNDTDLMINTLNDDGTFMFSDEQRKQKQKGIDKAHYVALRGNFNSLPAYQKKEYAENLMKDNVYIPVGLDDDKQVVMKNLEDIVSQETYEKFKEYANRVASRKKSISSRLKDIDDEDAWAIADAQETNASIINNEISNIKELGKNKPNKDILSNMGVDKGSVGVERVLRNLELQDNIQNMNEENLSDSDYKRFKRELMDELLSVIKNKEDYFDDAFYKESVMSTGLQVMKNDGKIGGKAWSDDMSVVMIRDFYSMAKDANLDLRATDSGSRESAKKIAEKAISNTIEKVAGGYGKEYNSVFINGQKVSKRRISDDQYTNPNYIIKDGKKVYNETGIEVEL